MVKEIFLTQGRIALVDDEDYERVMQYKWHVDEGKNTSYARAYILGSGRKKNNRIRLHRLIMNPKPWEQIDHISGDGLDNRRCNLRIVTNQQNNMRQRKLRGNSKYKGVFWDKRRNNWRCNISYNYKGIYLGIFDSEEVAAHAYDEAAKKYFGEYARLNFPDT